jgi:hypothetical protein
MDPGQIVPSCHRPATAPEALCDWCWCWTSVCLSSTRRLASWLYGQRAHCQPCPVCPTLSRLAPADPAAQPRERRVRGKQHSQGVHRVAAFGGNPVIQGCYFTGRQRPMLKRCLAIGGSVSLSATGQQPLRRARGGVAILLRGRTVTVTRRCRRHTRRVRRAGFTRDAFLSWTRVHPPFHYRIGHAPSDCGGRKQAGACATVALTRYLPIGIVNQDVDINDRRKRGFTSRRDI